MSFESFLNSSHSEIGYALFSVNEPCQQPASCGNCCANQRCQDCCFWCCHSGLDNAAEFKVFIPPDKLFKIYCRFFSQFPIPTPRFIRWLDQPHVPSSVPCK